MTQISGSQFSCMYFPYADIQPSQAVLMAALLFDKIYFLEKNFFRSPASAFDQSSQQVSIEMKQLDCFYEVGADLLGVSKRLHPGRSVLDQTVRKEIQASIDADLNNSELQQLIKDHEKVHWYLPNGQYLFWCGLGIIFDYLKGKGDQSLTPLDFFSSRADDYSEILSASGYKTEIKQYEEARIRNPAGELLVRMPFLFAESLMVSVALHASRELNLFPFTDNLLHQQFLTKKIANVVKSLQSPEAIEVEAQARYTELGLRSIAIQLPHINNLTPDRVFRLREKCKDQLQRFREEMVIMAADIQTRPWENSFPYDLQKYIDSKIRPAVRDLENKFHDMKASFGLNLFDKSAQSAPLPLVISLFSGFPIEYVLPASVSIVWLKEILSYLTERAKVKRNGLSFLLNL